jgi:voltage-gated potassium channel
MATDEPPAYLTPGLARWRSWTDLPLLLLATGSLPLLLLELKRNDLPAHDLVFIDAVNLVVLAAFTVDLVAELRLVDDRRAYLRGEYLGVVVVVSQFVALAPLLAGFGALRGLRAVRLVRFLAIIVRTVAIGGTAAREGRRQLRRRAGSFALGVAGMTWLTAAAAFTIAEDVGENGRHESFFDALWWALATITTVGYGDVFPVTTAGRLVGAFTMLIGISTFAVVTAKVAEFLVRRDDSDVDTAT